MDKSAMSAMLGQIQSRLGQYVLVQLGDGQVVPTRWLSNSEPRPGNAVYVTRQSNGAFTSQAKNVAVGGRPPSSPVATAFANVESTKHYGHNSLTYGTADWDRPYSDGEIWNLEIPDEQSPTLWVAVFASGKSSNSLNVFSPWTESLSYPPGYGDRVFPFAPGSDQGVAVHMHAFDKTIAVFGNSSEMPRDKMQLTVSLDGGANWAEAGFSVASSETDFFFDWYGFAARETTFIVSHSRNVEAGGRIVLVNELWRSTESGAIGTWQLLRSTSDLRPGVGLPGIDSKGFAVTAIGDSNRWVGVLAEDFIDPGRGKTTSISIETSTDNGLTWQQTLVLADSVETSAPGDAYGITISAFVADKKSSLGLFMTFERDMRLNPPNEGLYKFWQTLDFGQSFNVVNTVERGLSGDQVSLVNTYANGFWRIATDPSLEVTSQLQYSQRGDTWQTVSINNVELTAFTIKAIVYSEAEQAWVIAVVDDRSGIQNLWFRSTDLLFWQQIPIDSLVTGSARLAIGGLITAA